MLFRKERALLEFAGPIISYSSQSMPKQKERAAKSLYNLLGPLSHLGETKFVPRLEVRQYAQKYEWLWHSSRTH